VLIVPGVFVASPSLGGRRLSVVHRWFGVGGVVLMRAWRRRVMRLFVGSSHHWLSSADPG
jgi:hypothetical protein